MSISENITLSASNKASQAFKDLGNDAKKATGEIVEGNKEAKNSWTEVNSAINTAQKVYATVKAVIDQTIGANVNLAMTVKDAARAMGASATEASALLEVADDLRVDVGSLKIAFRNLNDAGIAPNIDNLKKLIVEYQGLPDSVSKAQFAAEKFGQRVGPEMQKLLEATPESIDAIAQSAEKAGKIMDEKAVAAAERYRLSLDQLNDSWEGFKIQAGEKGIPILTTILDLMNQSAEAGKGMTIWERMGRGALGPLALAGTIKDLVNAEQGLSETEAEAARQSAQLADDRRWAGLAAYYQAQATDDATTATSHLIDAQAKAVAIEQMRNAGVLDHIAAMDAYRESQDQAARATQTLANAETVADQRRLARLGVLDQLKSAEQRLADASVEWGKKMGQDAANAMEQVGAKGKKLEEALKAIDSVMGTNLSMQHDYSSQLLQLAKDFASGKIDSEEFKTKLAGMKEAFKPLSEGIMGAITDIGKLQTAYDALKDKTITITTVYRSVYESGGAPGGAGQGGKSGGKPYQHGGQFRVAGAGGIDQVPVRFMATAGETVTVTPAGEKAPGKGGGGAYIDQRQFNFNDAGAARIAMEQLRRERVTRAEALM